MEKPVLEPVDAGEARGTSRRKAIAPPSLIWWAVVTFPARSAAMPSESTTRQPRVTPKLPRNGSRTSWCVQSLFGLGHSLQHDRLFVFDFSKLTEPRKTSLKTAWRDHRNTGNRRGGYFWPRSTRRTHRWRPNVAHWRCF